MGRGVDEIRDFDGRILDYKLSAGSAVRAEAMTRFYFAHPRGFHTKGGRIVLSGGYAETAGRQAPPPFAHREAAKMADFLLRQGVPAKIIETEIQSGSTVRNLAFTLQEGYYIKAEPLTDEDPLLLVTSKQHGMYRGAPLSRAARHAPIPCKCAAPRFARWLRTQSPTAAG